MNGHSRGWQCSLRSLFGLMTFVAIACAMLVNASNLCLLGLSTFMFVVVMAAAIVGLFGHGKSRAFAGGFLICCVAYLSLIYLALEKENDGAGRIATTRLLKHLFVAVAVQTEVATPFGVSTTFTPDHDVFMQTGQLIWAILIGGFGGMAASYVANRRASEAQPEHSSDPERRKEKGEREHRH